ncbi:hypothetical protein CfE428DRAFT_6414 [Chthoniobacter flavus Ellin428]|uniref:Uncharacterized protein n=1 Tax=Chthoniobacter flavus Ellin428 TaxID=497964 RepID=B4DBX3_9BACT|nr:hypothetical protein CfE428DRAFT_6414 [Chthoniobacter flavus Ellin428]TCO87760.1 hypothetical protein EV701_12059 [Chthoniobacter flavus]
MPFGSGDIFRLPAIHPHHRVRFSKHQSVPEGQWDLAGVQACGFKRTGTATGYPSLHEPALEGGGISRLAKNSSAASGAHPCGGVPGVSLASSLHPRLNSFVPPGQPSPSPQRCCRRHGRDDYGDRGATRNPAFSPRYQSEALVMHSFGETVFRWWGGWFRFPAHARIGTPFCAW